MKMKNFALALLLFIGYGILWAEPADNISNRPLTWDIVRSINNWKNFRNAKFYLSKSFSITDRSNVSGRFDFDEDGVYAPSGENIPEIVFDSKVAGKMRSYDSETNIFYIVFDVGSIEYPLRFKRNSQGRYECDLIVINSKSYNIRPLSEGVSVQLCIKTTLPAEKGENIEMKIITSSQPENIQHKTNVQQTNYNELVADNVIQRHTEQQQFFHKENVAVNKIYTEPQQIFQKDKVADNDRQNFQKINANNPAVQLTSPSRNIEGQGYVNKRGISAYVIYQDPSVNRDTLSRLIDTYIYEAQIEGINHDIAIAQMLYTTNFLTNRRMTSQNFGGLDWNGSFYDMSQGVRAHIQHLKGYSSGHLNNKQLVDPRYQILAEVGLMGTVKTFDGLYRVWSPNNSNYGNNINRILEGLYFYSAN